jgi:hypothetical protein
LGSPFSDEATDAMLMIEPRPFFSMPGMNALDTRNIDFTFTANAWSQSFTEASRIEPWWTMPAQLKRMSMSPTSEEIFWMSFSLVTSSGRALMPSLPSSSATD